MKFCTKLDHFYLDRGLALYASLRQVHKNAEILILCLSDDAAAFLEGLKLPALKVIRVGKVFAGNPGLEAACSSRTKAASAFTLTPYIALEALSNCSQDEVAIYVDSDMMFFGSTDSLTSKIQTADVVVTAHSFSEHMRGQQRFGTFNTGFTGFRNTEAGRRCANWWAERCLEWCDDKLEGEKFADQKYIEQFSKLAKNTVVIDDPGINCAPWNSSGRHFSCGRDGVTVDGRPLIVYHFSKVKRIRRWCIATGLNRQGVIGAKGINRHVYRPYAKALAAVTHRYSIPSEWTLGRRSAREGAKQQRLHKDDNPGFVRLLAGLASGQYVTPTLAR